MPLVLGVDSGATATTAEFRDADTGHLHAAGSSWYPPTDRPDVEADPRVWWEALVDASHEAGPSLAVAAVGVAAQPGLVVLDEAHEVLRPARLAGARGAARDAANLVDALGGPADWAVAVGSVPNTATPIAQLARLRRTEPGQWGRVATVLTPGDWLTYRLSQSLVTDRGDASSTGYWSPRENLWRVDLLAFVDEAKDWGLCLPRLCRPDEPAGDRLGVVITPGTGEPMAAALGMGLRPGDVVMALDQTARVFALRERPTADPTGNVLGLADATGRYLPTVPVPNGMNAIGTVARLLGIGDRQRFDQLAMGAPAGSGGVTVLPDFVGVPTLGGPVAGMVTGLGANVTAGQLARATIEGVACSLLDALDALRAANVPAGGRLLLIGDGARSRAFSQILADVAERAVVAAAGDWVAAGAAVQAAAALHGRPPGDLAGAWDLVPTRELEPDPAGAGSRVRAQFRAAQTARAAAHADA
jgi:xylulokinase